MTTTLHTRGVADQFRMLLGRWRRIQRSSNGAEDAMRTKRGRRNRKLEGLIMRNLDRLRCVEQPLRELMKSRGIQAVVIDGLLVVEVGYGVVSRHGSPGCECGQEDMFLAIPLELVAFESRPNTAGRGLARFPATEGDQ